MTNFKLDSLSKVNLASQKLSVMMHNYLKKKSIRLLEFPLDELSRRIRQVIFVDYSQPLHNELEDHLSSLDNLSLFLSTKTAQLVNSSHFKIVISKGFLISRFVRYLGSLLYVFLISLKYLIIRHPKREMTLFFNPGLREYLGGIDMPSRFGDFCFQGRYEFLRNSDLVICWSEKRDEYKSDKLILTPNIYEELIRNSKINLNDIYFIFSESVVQTLKFSLALIKSPELIYLSLDLQKIPLIRMLNRKKKLKHVVLNTSLMYSQELWLHFLKGRYFQSHLIWYGMSTSELKFKGVTPHEWAGTELFYMENNYFWNEFHKQDGMRVLGFVGHCETKGSNLFYLPRIRLETQRAKRVLVFLNNPKSPEFMKSYLSKDAYYYGRFENQKKFFDDVLQNILNLKDKYKCEIEIRIKLKREYNPSLFDNRLAGLIKEVELAGCQFLENGADLYNEIANCDAVICTPTSTPVFLALEQNIPGLYYDPVGVIDPEPYKSTAVVWCANFDSLKHEIESCLFPSS